ncbi:bis(5'-nucleosyl)-tetraphosphatase (symmetrical) YqeK [Mechercharimyces sp. CAU 1602]|uniref:bis(5'-nucleosyl)-tetraphosphatase (symmetrical) YqeK n=1 Tax=Mechercharimyces sp. CAU 1602 TaxID=2973933 RepID=UPI002163C00C|nr:bis(5'-nucleosyl)-tetraphosphatase (symmetrical) YqeK [Mechercharimyces sp. CAU 1602]MCS1350405.1 bis(5'-nucleosyl)-tetraphosphatase (symmetrical) YqeK [Mechercharimyces sp. CAU 1602]
MRRENWHKIVEAALPPARWQHTVRVQETAVKLAKKIGIESEYAIQAALLHDYCKYWSRKELATWITRCHLPVELLQFHKELWHGPVGAEVAREQFGVEEVDVLNAIRYHTSGRPGMSLLEKVIFLADYIEPGRRFPGVEEVRVQAEGSLDLAVMSALRNTVQFLLQQQQKVYPLTLLAYNDLYDQLSEDERKNCKEESH